MRAISFTYVGLGFLLGKAHGAVVQATTESGEHLLAAAQDETPVDTGTLRASGTVEVTSSATSATATVTFGGAAADYAIWVHEGTSRGMPAFKYLERPLLANASLYREAMARAARDAF